ncbi:hypothetical protein ES288_A01G191400v1 [Gossypium darwinii]|uniref:Uncharacterized protein n=1 Tax=Gossypium darwinii TaxID=34276 RepID=A0A5D2HQE5_GOSDA|nr:hypothetical protein ES288_A01G191400v1 [Gossypium darwinii]
MALIKTLKQFKAVIKILSKQSAPFKITLAPFISPQFSPLLVLCSAKFGALTTTMNQKESLDPDRIWKMARAETRTRGWWRTCAAHPNCWLLRERENP